MTLPAAFWRLHEGLDRQGPGEPADVAWALAIAGTGPGARILDAGCGTGADIAALMTVSGARITAVDTHPPFVETLRRRFPGVTAEAVSMAEVPGPFEFIWCAGALYFLGVEAGLGTLAAKLAPGGAIAFSDPVWLTDAPPEPARAFWSDYPDMGDVAALEAKVRRAGLDPLGTRILSSAAWEAYYAPMAERLAALCADAGPEDRETYDAAAAEIALRRDHGDAYGYALVVARP